MRKPIKLAAVVAASALALAACGSSDDKSSSMSNSSTTATTAMSMGYDLSAVKTAPDLRVAVDNLLGDHLILAAKATGSALAGSTDEFKAYSTQLNDNGTDLGKLIGAAYGTDAQSKFNSIWSAHNGFFVDYTTGVATNDEAKKTKAVSDLTTVYVPQFSSFIADATGLPLATVTSLVTEHVTGTKAIVDDQSAKNYTKEVSDTRAAYAHMKMMGDPIAAAIATKFPDKFPASGSSKASDLRATVNVALEEHLYLATFATGSALAGRTDEFKAWGDALNTNGTEIGSVIGSAYGASAQSQFNSIWSAHNGFFVDYTTGVATNDEAKKSKAVSDLTTVYVPQFSKFISDATGLPNDTVTTLVTEHVTTTKAVVDDQGAKNWSKAASDDRMAALHMQSIADPFASATATKFKL